MLIGLGSDHGGFALKEAIKEYLIKEGHEIKDFGTHSEDSVDYPLYGHDCATAVAKRQVERGIVVCGTGIGISISANKVKGVRCALCCDEAMAEMARKHNDANVLALGGRTTEESLALKIVETWLNTDFEGGRHQRRVDILDSY